MIEKSKDLAIKHTPDTFVTASKYNYRKLCLKEHPNLPNG
jgi:hypothetical protein